MISETPQQSDADGAALAARWLQPDGDQGTQRETALRSVRERVKSGPAAPAAPLDLRGIRLSGEDLSDLDLSRADLSGADLSGANLSRSRLTGACLQGAVLCGADLTGAELLNANLSAADLSGCRGERAGFGNADLRGANLFQATLDGATLTRACLCDADLRAAQLIGARLLDADLQGANFSRAVLQRADLEKSNVERALFVDADLREARFREVVGHAGADWIGADILGVDFCGAYLVRRTIADQNYLHEFRNQNRASSLVYWIWWATSNCGRSFLRWGLWTFLVVTVFAGLYEGVALDYGDHRTILSSFYYSVVTLTTLGYGDILPASTMAQVLAICEVAIGYVMLGGLLSIFANKMARRAD